MDASHDVTARSVPLTSVTVAVVMPLPTLRLTPLLRILSPSFHADGLLTDNVVAPEMRDNSHQLKVTTQ